MLARGTHLLAALVVCAAPALQSGEISYGHEESPRGSAPPIRFLPNRGQWLEEVQFGVRAPSRTLLLRDGWAMGLERWEGTEPGARERHGVVVRMTFGAALPAVLQGESDQLTPPSVTTD